MRFAKRKVKSKVSSRRSVVRVGFVPTIDCAVIAAAMELGLFRHYGLNVELTCEVGWATIREKLLHEEIDAAAAHASMLFSIYCGIGTVRRSCLTGVFLGSNGSAITLSRQLWDDGVRDAASLGEHLRHRESRKPLVFGVVLGLSSQNYNLRKWLRSGNIDPDRDVRIVVIPSALVYDLFRDGYLDGYCVAEPWNSAAALSGDGWVAEFTSEIEPNHPEKVLLVLQEFAEQRKEEHIRLIAALIDASRYCDDSENRLELAAILAKKQYFDVPVSLIENALSVPFHTGHELRRVNDLVVFDALRSGRPDRAKGRWVYDMVRSLDVDGSVTALRPEIISKVFREDLFDEALLLQQELHEEIRPPVFPLAAPHTECSVGGTSHSTANDVLPFLEHSFDVEIPVHANPRTHRPQPVPGVNLSKPNHETKPSETKSKTIPRRGPEKPGDGNRTLRRRPACC